MKMRRKKILAMFLAFSIVLQQGGVAEVTTAGRTVQAEETASAPDAEALAAPATETASAPDMEASAVSAEETASAPDTEASAAPAEKTASATDTEASSVPLTEAPAQNQTDNAAEPEFIIDPVYVQQSDSSVPQQETTETLPDVNENVQPELKLDNAAQTDADHTLPYIALELTRPDGFPADADWKLELLNEEEKTGLTADINMNLADGLVLRFSVEQNGSACDIAGAKAVFDGLDDSYLADGHLSMYRNGVWEELSAVFFEDAGRVRASFPLDAIGILCFWKPVQPQESETEAPETKETETEAKKEETEETETETKKEETEETETETKKEEAEETETETKKEEAEETETKKEETEETETETKQEETEETETEEAETNKGQSDIPQMEGPGMEDPGMEDSGVEEPVPENFTVCEILYDTGEMVFQTESNPDPNKGEVIGKWFDDGASPENRNAADWKFHNVREQIKTVTFKDDVPLKSLQFIFSGCTNLKEVNINGFLADDATSWAHAFEGCTSLTSLDLRKWTTPNATNRGYMFNGCTGLTNLDVSNWNTSLVTNIYQTFQNCILLESLDVKNWVTSDVENMMQTFQNCKSLKELNLSNWSTIKVPDANHMSNLFTGCTSLSSLTLGSGFIFKNGAVGGLTGSWRNEDGEIYTADQIMKNAAGTGTFVRPKVYEILYADGTLVFQDNDTTDPSRWEVVATYNDDGSKADSDSKAQGWAFQDNKDKIEHVIFLDDVKLVSLRGIFNGCTNLKTVDTTKYTAVGVSRMDSIFRDCKNLENVNLGEWDLSSATMISNMFQNCERLTTILGISNWDISKVTNANEMFSGCKALTELDLSGWKAQSGLSMWKMFSGCESLSKISLGENFHAASNTELGASWKREENDNYDNIYTGLESHEPPALLVV